MALYNCVCCNFKTTRLANYDSHMTQKHHISSKNHVEVSHDQGEECHTVMGYICKYCGKEYTQSSSVSKHVKYSCEKNSDEDLKELVRLKLVHYNRQEMSMKNDK